MIKKSCCEEPNIVVSSEGHYNVCSNCGIVQHYLYDYEINYCKPVIYKKADYMMKKIKKICEKTSSLSNKDELKENVLNLFNKISDLLSDKGLINKYSLNYNFIISKIFEKLNIDKQHVKMTKNKSLIEKYDRIWKEIEKDLE